MREVGTEQDGVQGDTQNYIINILPSTGHCIRFIIRELPGPDQYQFLQPDAGSGRPWMMRLFFKVPGSSP